MKGSWFDFKNQVIKLRYGTSLSDLVTPRTGQYLNNLGFEPPQVVQAFDIKEAHSYYLNMRKEIYPDINKYLTGTESLEQRFLTSYTTFRQREVSRFFFRVVYVLKLLYEGGGSCR